MKTTRFFRDAAKNPEAVVLLLAVVALMVFLIVGDIINMRDATRTTCIARTSAT